MALVRIVPAVVALLLTGCTGSGDGPKGQPPVKVERNQVAARTAPPKLPDRGPQPGVLREKWRIKGFDRGPEPGTAEIRQAADQIFVRSGPALTGYDPGTGTERWKYSERDRNLLGYAVTGGALIVRSASVQGAEPVVTGLDAATGAFRWERQLSSGWEPAAGPAWAGQIVADYETGTRQLHGLDVTSGEKRWERQVEVTDGCRLRGDPDTDGSVLVLWEVCEDPGPTPIRRLHGFDPADGRELWSREIGAAEQGTEDDNQRVSVRRGTTLVAFDRGRPVLIGRDGRAPADLAVTGGCRSSTCSMLAAGDTLVLRFSDRYWRVGGGKASAMAPTTGWLTATSAGGRLFGLRKQLTDDDGKPLLPSAVEVVDPAGGAVVKMPLPARLIHKDPQSPSSTWADAPRWSGAGSDLLVLARGRDLVGYTSAPATGPVALAGVPAKSWPEACGLLGPLRSRATNTIREDISRRFGPVRLERKDCMLMFKASNGSDLAYVAVEWVAPTAEHAASLIDGKPLAGADEVEERNSTSSLVRVGRYLLRVNADEEASVTDVIAVVARQLR